MLATFEDFISQNQNCKKFENDFDMKFIFEYLSIDRHIVKMIDASEAGKPALSPVALQVEELFADMSELELNTLDDDFTKQAIGRMVKTILEPFGYVPWKQKDMPLKSKGTKFQSAAVYRFSDCASRSMHVVRRIEELPPDP